MKWRTLGKVAAKLAPPVVLAFGAALVDTGLLDARLYRAAVAVAGALGLPASN